MDVNYGLTYQGDIYSSVGLIDGGEKLSGYAVSDLSLRLTDQDWGVTFFIDNMFDKYAYTSVRDNKALNDDLIRKHGHYVLTPRTVGVNVEYLF